MRNQAHVPDPLNGALLLLVILLALPFGGFRLRHCICFRLSLSVFGILGGQSSLALLVSLPLSGLMLADSARQLSVRLAAHRTT